MGKVKNKSFGEKQVMVGALLATSSSGWMWEMRIHPEAWEERSLHRPRRYTCS